MTPRAYSRLLLQLQKAGSTIGSEAAMELVAAVKQLRREASRHPGVARTLRAAEEYRMRVNIRRISNLPSNPRKLSLLEDCVRLLAVSTEVRVAREDIHAEDFAAEAADLPGDSTTEPPDD